MAGVAARNMEDELRDLIAEIVEMEPGKITAEANFVEDLGMDSMMALEILAAMEKKYKIQIPEEKLAQLRNLKDTVALARQYVS